MSKLDPTRKLHVRHGYSYSPTYRSWQAMLDRCYNKNHLRFKHYGGRGILVCDHWHTFMNFLTDMGERPVGRSIDRINIDLGYTPENCRWATKDEQAANRRRREPWKDEGISRSWWYKQHGRLKP